MRDHDVSTPTDDPLKSGSIRHPVMAWLLFSLVGGAIVALPDDGRRLFSLSPAHGPSAQDALGIMFLLAGWVLFIGALWRRRARLAARVGTPAITALTLALGFGAGLLLASVTAHFTGWWLVGAAILAAAQLAAAYLARA